MTLPIRAALALVGLLSLSTPAVADLDSFVQKPDPSFAWSTVETQAIGGLKAHQLKLTSQTWQGKPWTHDLQIFEPSELKYPDLMLLFITGGANKENNARFRNAVEGIALAKACGASVAVLPQVPNQPLMDGKTEDDLIAETFLRYLATKDDDLPLLQPMVKSAVRAMDAVQEWAKKEGRPVPTKFVVSGASKRGWTTWLTGAVDPRVAAIAPMVIPTLNMKAQNKHQLETWGKYSEQIEDYTKRGLLDDIDKPDRTKLWKLIDPYTYLDRLTMPKLQINGTNDPYWTLDSLNLYWNDLKGPSYVLYLSNAVHNLAEHRDWAINGVGALFRHVATGKTLTSSSAEYKTVLGGDGKPQANISVTYPAAATHPKLVNFWKAHSETLEFRTAVWSIVATNLPPLKDVGTGFALSFPTTGNDAIFMDMLFEIDGLEYHLSTPIIIYGADGKKL